MGVRGQNQKTACAQEKAEHHTTEQRVCVSVCVSVRVKIFCFVTFCVDCGVFTESDRTSINGNLTVSHRVPVDWNTTLTGDVIFKCEAGWQDGATDDGKYTCVDDVSTNFAGLLAVAQKPCGTHIR